MSIVIPIISEFNSKGIDRAKREFGQLETVGQKSQFLISKAAIPATGALLTLAGAAKQAVEDASDLQEVQSKVGIIFGTSAKEVEAFAATAAKNLGQSTTEALNASATFATFGKSAGLAGTDLVGFSTKFTTLASDLASFNNTSPQDAINAIGSALRGEAEPLRKYGVLIDDATLRQAALSLGLIKTTKEALTPQNKVLAAQKVIYEQTMDAQGDFERTSDSLANQQKILAARLETISANVGMKLIPILSDYTQILNNVISFQGTASDSTQKWIDRFITFGKYLSPGGQLINGIKTADGAFRGLAKRLGLLADDEVSQLNRVMTNTGANVWKTKLAFSALTAEKVKDTTATKGNAEATKKTETAKRKLAEAAKKLAEDLKDAREALTDQFAEALKGVTDKLEDAQKKFDDFAKSVSSSVMAAINFGDAQSDAQNNVKNLNDAVKKQAEAQEKLAKAMKGTDIEAQTEAMQDLVEANFDLDEARKKPMSFFDNLKAQAVKAKDFGVLVNRLIAGGISDQALSLVLDAGVDAGTSIAQEILSGGENAITGPDGVNTLVSAAQSLADKTGELAAKKFYQAGVDSAKALVAGMQSIIDKYTPMMNAPGISPIGVAGLGVSFANEAGGVTAGGGGFDLSGIDWSSVLAGVNINVGGLATLSQGGIVTSPTIALIGEGGESEAVIPLSKMGQMGGGNTVTINVNGGDPNAVVDALRSYMRQNGSVPIKVSNIG